MTRIREIEAGMRNIINYAIDNEILLPHDLLEADNEELFGLMTELSASKWDNIPLLESVADDIIEQQRDLIVKTIEDYDLFGIVEEKITPDIEKEFDKEIIVDEKEQIFIIDDDKDLEFLG